MLCNTAVKLVLKLDYAQRIHFAPLEIADQLGLSFDFNSIRNADGNFDTLVFYSKGKIFTASDAILEAGRVMGGIYKIALVFKILPKGIRDGVYRWIAKNRYAWFGTYETCPILPEKWRSRILVPPQKNAH